jgi:hypothetical protein
VEDIVKTKPVPVIGKDLLPGVATEDHVVNGTICMNTRFTRHVIRLPLICKSARPDPIDFPGFKCA